MAEKHGYGVSTKRDAKNLAETLSMIARNITIATKATTDDPDAWAAFNALLVMGGNDTASLDPQIVLANQAAALYRISIYVLTGNWPTMGALPTENLKSEVEKML